jgi:c-Rel proto-oncogene protein
MCNKRSALYPYNLIGGKSCKHGVCTLEVSSENKIVIFTHFGIQCIRKRNVKEALEIREELGIDPFQSKLKST